MIELGASSGLAPMAGLVAISFFSFLAGQICRKWPEKVRDVAESLDGSLLYLSPEAHRALIRVCGATLSTMSFAALLAAAVLF
ncbi:MAG: hypothetical protein JXB36_02765 [Gammaproteobacteria bacterium]|nr:hypothetical protein [Gammaproteobacteria bacterium]